MIEKVVIKDNTKSPLHYLPELDNFKNGAEYIFKPGINVIVGKNGTGKTTLMKLIERYLIVDKEDCSVGEFNSNVNALVGLSRDVPDGIDVYADYDKNTFRLCHSSEKRDNDILSDFESFGTAYMQKHASTGEGVTIALNSLFKKMFGKGAKLRFDYDGIGKNIESYGKYVESHRVQEHDEWTILMDEPDRNLDIENIGQIRGILTCRKEQTQVIAVVHNPLLIYALSKSPDVNFIEMTPGYVECIKRNISEIVQ